MTVRTVVRLAAISARERAFASADSKMAAAKNAFSLAAVACLSGSIDATEKTRVALALVDAARAEIARVADSDEPDTEISTDDTRGRK